MRVQICELPSHSNYTRRQKIASNIVAFGRCYSTNLDIEVISLGVSRFRVEREEDYSCWKSTVGLRGSIPDRGKRLFSTPQRPNRLWGPLRLSNGCQWLFPREQRGLSVRLITHLQLLQRSRMLELYFHSPIRLHTDNFTYACFYV
jgi:hypothetical protein